MIQFDCHAHVYETAMAISGARYTPKTPAPLAHWLDHQTQHGLKGGVIVQVSFLGTDNTELCAALDKLDRKRFAGVAIVALDVSDTDLDRLVQAGIRGIRWNLVRGAEIPDLAGKTAQTLFEKLRKRSLHLEVHLEGRRLATKLASLADQGVKLVVDHFGLPSEPNPEDDPMIQAVSGLGDLSNLYFKFSAHYRTSFDLRPHAQFLLSKLPNHHVVWGSDWPHTQHEDQITYQKTFAALDDWRHVTDEESARSLYGIQIT
ncbi:MAG: amidohydrolase family protein [Boseongicola sp.]|nr:MAG: amidohydrolase family protein [Boseongicola sp.]